MAFAFLQNFASVVMWDEDKIGKFGAYNPWLQREYIWTEVKRRIMSARVHLKSLKRKFLLLLLSSSSCQVPTQSLQ